jgi:arylsulfatase A-like enzyme
MLATLLKDADYITGLVFDTWHYKSAGFSLERGYDSWEWVRGQEGDKHYPTPRNPVLPANPAKMRNGATTVSQYLRNQSGRQGEADYMVARTVQAGIDWLQRNDGDAPFFLHIDSFDPHEPWDPPQQYVDLYNPNYTGEQVIYPAHAPPDYLTAAELAHVRALYAAEVTMVDHWLGVLLAEIDGRGLSGNTIVTLVSDHGIMLGEHNAIGKRWSHNGNNVAYPLYEELAHIPMMFRVPGVAPQQLSALAQPADIMPTLLDYAGIFPPPSVHGKSLRPYMEGQSGSPRDVAISSRSFLSGASEARITVNDGEWVLLHGAAHAPSALYYLPDDPQQANNILAANCGIAQALHTKLIAFLEDLDTPASSVDVWRPPPC